MASTIRFMRDYLYGCVHLAAQWLRLWRYRTGRWKLLKDTGYVRKGTRLAVLGAGPSAPDAAARVGSGTDVLALSYAALLSVPVAVVFFEFAPPIQQANQARLIELLKSRLPSHSGERPRYIYKSHLPSDTITPLGSDIFTVPALLIPPVSRPAAMALYRLLLKLRLHGRYLIQVDGLGSLSSAVGFARWFGYTEILMGGIDGETRRYYFDADEFSSFDLANPFALEGATDLDVPHPTASSNLTTFVSRLTEIASPIPIESLVPGSSLSAELARQRDGRTPS